MKFEFGTAARIVFASGALRDVSAVVTSIGKRPFVVTGRELRRAEALLTQLRGSGFAPVTFSIDGEPELAAVEQGTMLAKAEQCDCVIGIGGGSAIDAAKAISAMMTNEGVLLDYLEVIGRGRALATRAAPVIAIPTTAGTGAEVTRNAVLASSKHKVKVSLRSSFLLPHVAVVDPELTCDLPPALTASTGLDALTQLIEPYVCLRANPMTDALCIEGLRRAARSLRVAFTDGQNKAAREDMALASLFGGLALANAGLGAVHGFAAPIGGMFPAPHGAVCAALLPHVMEMNLRTLRERMPGSAALRRYDEVARLLTGHLTATANDGVQWVSSLVRGLAIPPLSAYGIQPQHTNDIVAKATNASSMKANPIVLNREELGEVLQRAADF